MSRYIEADALIADLDKGLWGKDWDKALAIAIIGDAPTIDIVRCKECIYYDPPHVENHGERIEYADLPEEAFDMFGAGVEISYGINIGGRCCVDHNIGYAEDKRVYRSENNFCGRGRRKRSE